jgi:hypothetical protein
MAAMEKMHFDFGMMKIITELLEPGKWNLIWRQNMPKNYV